jgi:hypothetical protein
MTISELYLTIPGKTYLIPESENQEAFSGIYVGERYSDGFGSFYRFVNIFERKIYEVPKIAPVDFYDIAELDKAAKNDFAEMKEEFPGHYVPLRTIDTSDEEFLEALKLNYINELFMDFRNDEDKEYAKKLYTELKSVQ